MPKRWPICAGRNLAGPVIALLAGQGETRFADRMAWQAHLDHLDIPHVRRDALKAVSDLLCDVTLPMPLSR